MPALYDTIGLDYARLRRPDPRIGAEIHAAMSGVKSVLNVGAGAGSYEPTGRAVTALEPSPAMIAQRPPGAAPCALGRAEELPFADDSFDAAMAVLTVHHWTDQARGLREMRRVARGPVVILTHDPAFRGAWLYDYFPDLPALDQTQMPGMERFAADLGPVTITEVPIPHDCTDGFLLSYWRRPTAYLDAQVRGSMSSFWKIGDVTLALARLRDDVESGAWHRRNGALIERETLDCGYRLVVSG